MPAQNNYLFKTGHAIPNAYVHVDTGNGRGSSNGGVRRFTNIRANIGTAITYADSSTAGASFTINQAGIYSITYSDGSAGGVGEVSISVNGTDLNVAPVSGGVTYAEGKRSAANAAATVVCSTSVTLSLAAGDIIRPQCSGSNDITTDNCIFTIIQVA